jgi:glucosamine--fructose-6-phosphate aminotransferase (isomerizing)
MSDVEVRMAHEIREAPSAIRRQEAALASPLAELAQRLKRRPPQIAVTCARGSSAHAATFGKHLIERYLGLPAAAAAPNIASVYGRQLRLKDQLFLAISQSGRSDDLVEMAISAKTSGALTVAIVNATDSPLAAMCDFVLPMSAGPELSVAATKSFIATLGVLLRLTAAWTGDGDLDSAVERLPDRLAAASGLDWSNALSTLSATASLVAIGRGPTLAIAREAALKLKEICNLHAEAFSGAEFLHGPVALVSSRYPVLMFMPADEAAGGMRQLAANLRGKGTALFTTEPGDTAGTRLSALASDHPETDAVCLIQSFYPLLVRLAERLGTDADRPRHLKKVTRTR